MAAVTLVDATPEVVAVVIPHSPSVPHTHCEVVLQHFVTKEPKRMDKGHVLPTFRPAPAGQSGLKKHRCTRPAVVGLKEAPDQMPQGLDLGPADPSAGSGSKNRKDPSWMMTIPR